MTIKLKPIDRQVVVILGASSGIGRETALRLSKKGARLIVGARSENGLQSLVDEIKSWGGDADYMVCDAADFEQVKALAQKAVDRFGRIDTWVNNAAVAVYALAEETTPEEFRRVMEVNYMGQVHGALAALPHLRSGGGGAIIGTSSVEGIVALPLHSAYAASKHAVEGFMDALRREMMAEGAPISITSVKPATINTPFFTNARNKMDVKPTGPSPVYHPAVVADCILYAAENPVRDLYAGGAAKAMAAGQMAAPGFVDTILAKFGISSARSQEPAAGEAPGTVDAPRLDDNRREGDFTSRSRRVSVYTYLETHPKAKAAAGVGGMLAASLLRLGLRAAPQMWQEPVRARRSGGISLARLAILPLGYFAYRWLSQQDERMKERPSGRSESARPDIGDIASGATLTTPARHESVVAATDDAFTSTGGNARPTNDATSQTSPHAGDGPFDVRAEPERKVADRLRDM
jgi:NAD(P)-dependent dehydrogenase (short-subunit alcohol dehydrogenase family)